MVLARSTQGRRCSDWAVVPSQVRPALVVGRGRSRSSAVKPVKCGLTPRVGASRFDLHYVPENNAVSARKVRLRVIEEGGVRGADAVYSIQPTLLRGIATTGAKVAVAGCVETGIPTV